jgi:hypothetical protein
MKRHARRAVIGAAALMALVVAVLTVANWGTVRDHVEAWRFQLTKVTTTIQPDLARKGIPVAVEAGALKASELPRLLQDLSNYSGRSVVFEPEHHLRPDSPINIISRLHKDIAEVETSDWDIKAGLRSSGYRVLEQRYPRRAYVVINPSLARASAQEPDSPRSWGLTERDKDRLRKALSGTR